MIQSLIVEITEPDLVRTGVRVFTTLEGENPGGSIKDHMVLGELMELLDNGVLKPGDVVSEVSAGSTALSLAYYGQLNRLKCHLFIPQDTRDEIKNRLKKLGAELHLGEKKSLYAMESEFSKAEKSHSFNQLYDPSKSRHYIALGIQLLEDLETVNLVMGAVGTGHSLKGIHQGLKGSLLCSAEPDGTFGIPGIRNVEIDRYGDKDSCFVSDFSKRIILSGEECYSQSVIRTSAGSIQISDSYRVVLGGLQKLLSEMRPSRIFTVGAHNRRLSN